MKRLDLSKNAFRAGQQYINPMPLVDNLSPHSLELISQIANRRIEIGYFDSPTGGILIMLLRFTTRELQSAGIIGSNVLSMGPSPNAPLIEIHLVSRISEICPRPLIRLGFPVNHARAKSYFRYFRSSSQPHAEYWQQWLWLVDHACLDGGRGHNAWDGKLITS